MKNQRTYKALIGRISPISLIWALSTLICAVAQAGELSVSLENPVTPFHRPSLLHIRYVGDPGAVLDTANLEKSLKEMEKVEVQRKDSTSVPLKDGSLQQEIVLSLDAITPGVRLLPTVSITAGTDALRMPPLLWNARDLTQQELDAVAQFTEITLPGDESVNAKRSLWWWAILPALALLAAGAWWWQRTHKPVLIAPPPPPWELAYRRLKELANRNLPEQGKFERYYVDLSSILRYYIEDRFALRAPEQTTQEFLDAASGKLEEEHRKVLAEFLRHCDRVKFARYEPNMNEMKRSFEIVKGFVEHTTPHVTVERDTAPSGEAAA